MWVCVCGVGVSVFGGSLSLHVCSEGSVCVWRMCVCWWGGGGGGGVFAASTVILLFFLSAFFSFHAAMKTFIVC